jgi:hypothetical protein
MEFVGRLSVSPHLKSLCEIASALADKIRGDLRGERFDSPQKWVVTYWFASAAKSFDAAILLWNAGYWQNAAMTGRSILEVALQAMFFLKDPTLYAQHFFVQAEKQKLDLFGRFSEFAEPAMKREIEDHFRQLGADKTKIKKWKNWWGQGDSIWELVSEIKAQNTYRSQYGPLSFLVHTTPAALLWYIQFEDGRPAKIDWKGGPPSTKAYPMAETMLTSAPTGLLDVMAVLVQIFGFEHDADFKAARSALEAYNNEDP